VPIEEYNPYYPKSADSKYETLMAESVIFTIQFIRESDELKINKTPIEDMISVYHPDLFSNIENLFSKPSLIEVQVNKRMDKFEGF
jgi:hypothetical protein